jgi:hypothetical protein
MSHGEVRYDAVPWLKWFPEECSEDQVLEEVVRQHQIARRWREPVRVKCPEQES